MDRNTVTGLILIALITLGWFYFITPSEEELRQRRIEQARQDSIEAAQTQAQAEDTAAQRDEPTAAQQQQTEESGPTIGPDQEEPTQQEYGIFGNSPVTDTTETVVETPLYRAVFTNVGAGPNKFYLKEYETWDHEPIQIIADTTKSAYALGFLTTENYNVETDRLLFRQQNRRSNINLQDGESTKLTYVLPLENDRQLEITYTLFSDTYEIDVETRFRNLQDMVIGQTIDYMWKPRLNLTEKTHSREAQSIAAYMFAAGELDVLNLSEAGTRESSLNGNVEWVASRTKFFAQIIKATEESDGAHLVGNLTGDPDKQSSRHTYRTTLTTELNQDGAADFRLYVGPLKYDAIKNFDSSAYQMVDLGFSWIRWFSEPLVKYAIIPFFSYVGEWVGNYGIAIIIFAFLIKLILYPLTKKSFESMAAMRELQPEIKALQEKYKDNPQKQQQETMKLYKKAKVNPLGGCLPMLLQFPILITLYHFFRNSIEIRQKAFLWAEDLSAPDVILSLPFNIPFLGDHLGGFVIIMAATMAVQTQLTGGGGTGGAGGQQMKIFQYVLPVILLFVFNNFAAGLSLYYLFFNALSIGQQLMINKNIDHTEMMKAVDPKKAKQMQKEEIKEKKKGKKTAQN